MILGTGAKWDGHIVWDCAQFTKAALKNDGVELVSGATSQWRKTDWLKSGTIDGIPNDVCCVFRESNGKMQHTGLFIGNNTVIHAKGTKYGVIKDNLGSYPWTHYALPKTQNNAINGGSAMNAVVTAENGKPVRMRDEASKAGNVLFAVDCGTVVEVLEQLDDWYCIKYRGKTGYMMAEFIQPTESQVNVESGSDGLYLYKKT